MPDQILMVTCSLKPHTQQKIHETKETFTGTLYNAGKSAQLSGYCHPTGSTHQTRTHIPYEPLSRGWECQATGIIFLHGFTQHLFLPLQVSLSVQVFHLHRVQKDLLSSVEMGMLGCLVATTKVKGSKSVNNPSVIRNITMENHHFWWTNPL